MNISIFELKEISGEGLNIINYMFKIVQKVLVFTCTEKRIRRQSCYWRQLWGHRLHSQINVKDPKM